MNNPRIGFTIIQLMLGLVIVSPVQAQQPAEFNLKLTPAEVDLIGEGLGLLPFNKVVPLINKLRSQVMEQQKVTGQAAPTSPQGASGEPEKNK